MPAIPPDQIRALGHAALERLAAYYESLPSRPVLLPTTSAALRELIDEPLPREGMDFPALLDIIDNVIARFARHSAHPRFFGYISSPGTPVTSMGSMLKAALNLNVTCWRSAPSATEIERLTIRWMNEMLGYPKEAAGLFTSGGSTANFTALAAARSAKAPANVVREGMAVAGKRMCLYIPQARTCRALVGPGRPHDKTIGG